jgi:ribulose-5-phosphate 4-epimerase/fuculose-1-phosphate aldolase
LLLKNHGQVTVGGNFKEAIQRAAFFEFASGIILQAGNQVKTLSEEAVEFLNNTRDFNVQRGI